MQETSDVAALPSRREGRRRRRNILDKFLVITVIGGSFNSIQWLLVASPCTLLLHRIGGALHFRLRSIGSFIGFVLGLIRKILKLMKISRCSCNRLSDVSFYCLLITIIVPLRPPFQPPRRQDDARGGAHMIGKHNPNNLIEIRSQRTNRTCHEGDDKMGTLCASLLCVCLTSPGDAEERSSSQKKNTMDLIGISHCLPVPHKQEEEL